ncbi:MULTISPECIES: hypothetical protein [Thiorhodovibrio]|nr:MULTISPECIES: hypothetical protein [Thiorhodovibrio]
MTWENNSSLDPILWDYPGDRIGEHHSIPLLPDIIRERAAAGGEMQ